MTLKKIVDGIEVEMSQKEEAETLAAWAAEDKKQAEFIANFGYISKRVTEYPSIGDQLDMLWHSMESGEIPKSAAFFSACKAIKDKYPKPN